MSQFSVVRLVESLDTNWKHNNEFVEIARKHANTIDEFISKDEQKFQGCLAIYPPPNLVFNAFNQFNLEDLKVIILGQDPYINENEAMGLSFSVPEKTKCPPSLRNIFKELEHEYGVLRTNTDLTDWAKQGVLLLNRSLTVREGQSLSHVKAWKDFTTDVLKIITKKNKLVYILWGQVAQEIIPFIDANQNLLLTHSHPSPLSRKPFVGNGHFKKCNDYLIANNKSPIVWIRKTTI